MDCLAPAKALRRAGIKPEGKNVYELPDGSPAPTSVPEYLQVSSARPHTDEVDREIESGQKP